MAGLGTATGLVYGSGLIYPEAGGGTLASAASAVSYPLDMRPQSAVTTSATAVADAAGEYTAYVIAASEDMSVSHVGWRMHAVSGSPTADIRIETVNTSGLPTGTLYATDTNVITGTLTATFAVHALTATAVIPRGTVFAVVCRYNSGTSLSPGAINIPRPAALPYQVTNTGTPAAAFMSFAGNLALGSSATQFYFIPGQFPIRTTVANAFNNSTAGAARGVRFQVPFACRCSGFANFTISTSNGNVNVKMLDDAGAELSSSSTAYISSPAINAVREYIFDNPVTLSANTWYRAVVEPTMTKNTAVYTLTVASNCASAMPNGSFWHYTTYTTAGGWVDTATSSYPVAFLLLDQLVS